MLTISDETISDFKKQVMEHPNIVRLRTPIGNVQISYSRGIITVNDEEYTVEEFIRKKGGLPSKVYKEVVALLILGLVMLNDNRSMESS